MHPLPPLLLIAVLSVSPTSASPQSCDGPQVLRRAAAAYGELEVFSDVVRWKIEVPGAPPKEEVLEYGFAPGVVAYLRMPTLYEVELRDGVLFVHSDGSTALVLEQAASDDLQGTLDAAFAPQGPPLVPPALSLRRASSNAERLDAFRLKLLGPLEIVGCQITSGSPGDDVPELELQAPNGRLHVTFDPRRSFLREIEAEVELGPGQPPIRAHASFAPRPGTPPPTVSAETLRTARRVRRLEELTEPGSPEPAKVATGILTTFDGSTVSLAQLRGSPVVLEFWATWCAPCRLALPAFEKFATWAQAEVPTVRVLLVNTEEDFDSIVEARARLDPYLRQAEFTHPSYLDLDNSLHRACGGGLPLRVLLDAEGRAVEVHGGLEADWESLQARLRELVK